MLVTPKLVWSRMFSHGTQQSAKLMFVVGEQGFADGESLTALKGQILKEFFWATMRLDVVHEDFFAFYWKNDTTVSGNIHSNKGQKSCIWNIRRARHSDPTQNLALDDDRIFVSQQKLG